MESWKKNVREAVPYVPGEQPDLPDMIKLNTNENPYPPSPKVGEALCAIRDQDLRLYPDPSAGELTGAVAGYYGLSREQVFVGVGSDDVLAMAFLTFFNGREPVLFPDITYSFYDVWAGLFRIPYRQVPLADDFTIRPEDYKAVNGGIVFPNPNAPTGEALSREAIEEIVAANPGGVVIVDEAYVDFGAVSALPLTEKYDNLLVVQTMSKSRSLAGMRIGYAMGNPGLIRCLNNVKYSFNSYTMDQTALAAGKAAMEDRDYFEKTRKKVIETREWTKRELAKLGFSFGDSMGNFIFAAHEFCAAGELFAALRERHIFVRYFDKPRISNYLRITVGTPEEMEALIDFLKKYLRQE